MKFAALSLTNAVALVVLGMSASAELINFVPPYADVTQVPWCKAPGPAKLPDVLNWYGLICRRLSVVRASSGGAAKIHW
ncbi:uncharacterized protein PFL1_04688 [Pseudozyma flocculosa PF-1]|uniref:Uncharacterized protein n=1 Tax=Pseudozyma flocculosa PF-1 TaxID=1277687 RepID=A0A061H648_9BASI|nr:uncharacterized protein PFL1_04688 [Pseudozyma flocculosa PF-1]EPQ27944.1 hypothetical protein PFL1_04688 [Pseudozyma flocculosa PF-1]